MAVQVIWGNRGGVEQSLLSGQGHPGLCDYSYEMSSYVVLGFASVFSYLLLAGQPQTPSVHILIIPFYWILCYTSEVTCIYTFTHVHLFSYFQLINYF